MNGLVLPADPRDESRVVARAYGRYLIDCGDRFLDLEPWLGAEVRPTYQQVAQLVRRQLAGAESRAMLSCFAMPSVGTPLHCLPLREDLPGFRDRIDAAGSTLLATLLFEMALRGLIPAGESVLCPHGAPALASTAIGGALLPPAGAIGWRFSASHVTAVGPDGELDRLPIELGAMSEALGDQACGVTYERHYWRLAGGAYFATTDANPIAAFEAHPDKAGNHVDLGSRDEDAWVAVLDEAYGLISRYLPGEAEEMATLLQQVIPVGYDDVKHLSASYREAVGTLYLTLHPNLMTMTEALIHEFQHNKFNLAAVDTEFLLNAFHPLYKSPIRPDPRPLWGIVLAVHAFLPVAELYRRMRDAAHPGCEKPDFERRLSEIDLKNHEGMEMLRAHAEWTPEGRALFSELEALERSHLADRAARGLDSTPTDVHLA
jgi:HEXXH motif-containing protein